MVETPCKRVGGRGFFEEGAVGNNLHVMDKHQVRGLFFLLRKVFRVDVLFVLRQKSLGAVVWVGVTLLKFEVNPALASTMVSTLSLRSSSYFEAFLRKAQKP